MFRRRKKKNTTLNGSQPESPSSTPAPNAGTPLPAAVSAHHETKKPPLLSNAFKSAIEKAADRSRSELASEGRIKPMVFFIDADDTMKTVSLSVKNEHQKEALIRRIREKVSAENISTVITLIEMDREHGAVLSGVSSGMSGAAFVDYSFDNKTKTVTLWKISWMNQPVQNVFLDGIFDKTGYGLI
jgi:hypothetical protein